MVRHWCVLYILTSKCASRHNGVHFFDISTSKSGPNMRCFLAFSVANVLRATMGGNFSSLILPAGSAATALASLLFDPPDSNHGKNKVFRDFPTFSRTWILFLRRLSLFDRLSFSLLLSDSSHLCYSSVHIVGSLTSKLPSNMNIYIYNGKSKILKWRYCTI